MDGDFVAFEGELQPVLKSLRASGINVVAIHNHMEYEAPKAIFLPLLGRRCGQQAGQRRQGCIERAGEGETTLM